MLVFSWVAFDTRQCQWELLVPGTIGLGIKIGIQSTIRVNNQHAGNVAAHDWIAYFDVHFPILWVLLENQRLDLTGSP